MKNLINSVVIASAITFFPATPLKADLSIAIVSNETGENITLECGGYVLTIPAGQRRQPLRLAVPSARDYECPCASVGNEYNRVYFWREGANLISQENRFSKIALKNMDIAHSAGLSIRVTPQGVIFRLLADFERTAVGTVCG